MAEFALHATVKAGESAGSLIDFFPFREHSRFRIGTILMLLTVQSVPDWLPGAASLREARQVRQSIRRLFDDPYHMIKHQFVHYTP